MINTIDEKTTKEELQEEYRHYPKTGGENLLEDKPFYESRLMPILYEVPLKSKVLDVGCNDGTFMQMMKDKRQCDVYGVDISEDALALAKSKNLNVQYADAHKLPFNDDSFDIVILSEVISHVQNPSEVLMEIRRVLGKRGILLGSAPHANLQTYVWEDARKIRQYYDEDQLHEVLGKSFDRSWIKVLKGGQFSISMAGSFLGNEATEMLFKCGGADTKNWDEALLDRSILRCWFGFTQGPGDVYYRMSGFADEMQKMGAETHYDPYDETDLEGPSKWTQKIRYIPSEKRIANLHIVEQLEQLLKASDLSVFQVVASRDALLILTALRDPHNLRKNWTHKPMWTEIDDWIFDLPSYNLASGPYQPNSDLEAIAYDQLKLSDGFICSTQYLKEKLENLVPGKPIYVIKNALDFDVWDNLNRPTKLHDENPDLVRITYSGCGNHSGDLEIIKKPIEVLLEEFPNLEFVSLPFPFSSMDSIKSDRYKRFNQWVGMGAFPQIYADWETDIAIAPLMDNEMNRAKSNLRWLESSALKIPMIASKVYPFQNSITDKKDGFIVGNSEKEWYEAMKYLILYKEKRTRIGECAYKKVRKDYSMDTVAKTYLSVLKNIKREWLREKGRDKREPVRLTS